MTALRHLVHLLRGTWFRRLFAVRVASQLTDGVFQVALASYVVFSPERAPGPGAIAAALAVVLLPFSVLGPFVGVLLDRWSRRQVLARANFVRVGAGRRCWRSRCTPTSAGRCCSGWSWSACRSTGSCSPGCRRRCRTWCAPTS